MKRVIITGASGFVGANLTRRLLLEGHEVHALLRASHNPWRLQSIGDDLHIHLVDMEDRESVSAAVKSVRPDWVFNLAAYGNYSTQTSVDRMISTNLTACVSLLDASASAGVEAFVQAGSSSEYGYRNHATCENDRVEPNSCYAITKAAATHACQFVARRHDLNVLVARLYSIYGPWEEPTRLIPTLIDHGLRGELPPLVSPQTARDFVFIEDAEQALLRIASMKPPERGAVFNVCSGVQTSLATVVSVARRLMNIEAEPEWLKMSARPWDTDVWVGSPALTTARVGWTCETDLESGLQRTIEWFKRNPPQGP